MFEGKQALSSLVLIWTPPPCKLMIDGLGFDLDLLDPTKLKGMGPIKWNLMGLR